MEKFDFKLFYWNTLVLTYLSDIVVRGRPEDMIHIFHVFK